VNGLGLRGLERRVGGLDILSISRAVKGLWSPALNPKPYTLHPKTYTLNPKP